MQACPEVHRAAGGPKRLTWYDDDHNFTSLDAKIDRSPVENYTEAMNLQAKLFREGQETGALRDGDPEVLGRLFSGIVSAYQAADPLIAGRSSRTSA